MGKGFHVDFVQNKLRLRWRVEGNLQVLSLLDRVLLFDLPSKETQVRIMAKGPWTLAGQLIAKVGGLISILVKISFDWLGFGCGSLICPWNYGIGIKSLQLSLWLDPLSLLMSGLKHLTRRGMLGMHSD